MAKPLKFWMSANPNAFLKNIAKGTKILLFKVSVFFQCCEAAFLAVLVILIG
jgi:hypothetical protein